MSTGTGHQQRSRAWETHVEEGAHTHRYGNRAGVPEPSAQVWVSSPMLLFQKPLSQTFQVGKVEKTRGRQAPSLKPLQKEGLAAELRACVWQSRDPTDSGEHPLPRSWGAGEGVQPEPRGPSTPVPARGAVLSGPSGGERPTSGLGAHPPRSQRASGSQRCHSGTSDDLPRGTPGLSQGGETGGEL